MKTINFFRKIFLAAIMLAGSMSVAAETIFSENMGTGASGNPVVTGYEEFQNYGTLTFTGTADVRSTSASSGYTTASGGNNVFITNTGGNRYFTISGINTSDYTDLVLSFGFWKSGAAAAPISCTDLIVEVATDYEPSTNTGTFTALSFATVTTASTWSLINIADGITSSSTLAIRFRQNQTTQQFRIDDVRLEGTPFLPYTITPASNNIDCEVSLSGNVITATPASCLYIIDTNEPYTVLYGTATIVQNGNKFTVTELDDDVTVIINFVENPTPPVVFEVTFEDNDAPFGSALQTDCGSITIPATAPTSTCPNWIFAGWAENSVDDETIITPATLYNEGDTFVPSDDAILYAVYKIPGMKKIASLTQEEIMDTPNKGSYGEYSVGDWTGLMIINDDNLQINTAGSGLATGSYILSPAFGGIITSIEVHFANEYTSTRTIRIMDLDDNLLGSYTVPASTTASRLFTDLDTNSKYQFKILSHATTPGALRITGIDVTYMENTLYNSNPECIPAIIVLPLTSSLDFGTVAIGKTSIGQTLTISGINLTDDLSYTKEDDIDDVFAVEETSWDDATGGTLTITFSPVAEGDYIATLTFTSAGAEPVIVELTGGGTIAGYSSCETTSQVTAVVAGNNIYVNNLPELSTIYVYNETGQLVVSQKANASSAILPVAQKGFLVIEIVSSTGTQTIKVVK